MDWLIGVDKQLFNFIRERMSCAFLDKWMPIVTDFDNWIWLMALGWLALFIFGGRRGRWACFLLLVAVLVMDNLNSYILKPLFARLRPEATYTAAQLAAGKGISYAFPSNHAVNVFTLAMVLSWYYARIAPVFFLGAAIVGFSRVYVGAHYPFDVVAGALAGISGALVIIWCANRIALIFGKKFSKG